MKTLALFAEFGAIICGAVAASLVLALLERHPAPPPPLGEDLTARLAMVSYATACRAQGGERDDCRRRASLWTVGVLDRGVASLAPLWETE
jgi:hypothetical protein